MAVTWHFVSISVLMGLLCQATVESVLDETKRSLCAEWTGPLDACYIYYHVDDVIHLPCTPDPTQKVDWLTCTGCSRPFNLTDQKLLDLPNTSLEIISRTDSNTLKLVVKKLNTKTTALSCYVHGQTNIQAIFHLGALPQDPGRYLPPTNVPQVCPLDEGRDLILSCRAGCFDPDQCTKTWMKDDTQLAVNKADVTVRESGIHACLDGNNNTIMTINVTAIEENVMVEGSQFCSYQIKPTTPERRTAEVTSPIQPTTSPTTTETPTNTTLTSLPTLTSVITKAQTTDGKETTSRNGDVNPPRSGENQANMNARTVLDDSNGRLKTWHILVAAVAVAFLGVVIGVPVFLCHRRRSKRGRMPVDPADPVSIALNGKRNHPPDATEAETNRNGTVVCNLIV